MREPNNIVALIIPIILNGCGSAINDVPQKILQDYQRECSVDAQSSPRDCFTSNWYIPHSLTDIESKPSTRIAISQTEITLNGTVLVSLEYTQGADGSRLLGLSPNDLSEHTINALKDALVFECNRQLTIEREFQIPDVVFRGDVVLSIDQAVPFQIIRDVMYTAGQAQFSDIYFTGYNPWLDEFKFFNTVLPAITSPILLEDQDEGLEFQLLVNVVINDDGLEVLTVNANELSIFSHERSLDLYSGDQQIESLTRQLIPCTDSDGAPMNCVSAADYNWRAFNELLIEIKLEHGITDDYPILIESKTDVSWGVISRTIDYARTQPFLEFGADLATWQEWNANKSALFNIPVIHGGL